MRHINTFRHYSRRFRAYHISTYAASASFFIIVTIFPMLILFLSAIQLTHMDPMEFIDLIYLLLPGSFAPLIEGLLELLEDASSTTVSVSLSLSLVMTLWTAAKGVLGLLDGLNAIADVSDTRNFIFRRLVCMGYMLLLIGVLVLNLGLRVFGRRIYFALFAVLPGVTGFFHSLLSQSGLTVFVAMTAIFLLIYTFFPGKKMVWYLQLPGAIFTALGWTGFSALFSIYVNNSHRLAALYGGLTMAVLAMLWLYFCLYILFIGAVINQCFPEGLRLLRGLFQKK